MASVKAIRIAGFVTCGFYRRARDALLGLSIIFPDKYSVQIIEKPTRDEYKEWLAEWTKNVPAAAKHTSSPVTWFDDDKYLGGCDDTLAWCRKVLSTTDDIATSGQDSAISDGFDPSHTFDYDIVVIGGGSGGLACSKRCSELGARVACLDYVKPSPAGSKWGLGGTCVNVGCIPKKLMHNAALLGEQARDAKSFGWTGIQTGEHDWEALRTNVQDHIKGLNFAYRVQLREKGVTYLNKLGRFTGPNTLECTDAKGKVQIVTAARFVVAVGGRPSKLQCEGGELAISSDDLFMLDKVATRVY